MFRRYFVPFTVFAKNFLAFQIDKVLFVRNSVNINCYSTIVTKSHYGVLGVKPDATEEEIKEAYYTMSKKYHPDLNIGNKNAESKMLEVNEAFEILGNKLEKEKYDSKMFPKVWERKPFIYNHEARPKTQNYIYRRVPKEMSYTAEQHQNHYKGELKRKRRHAVQKIMFHKSQSSKTLPNIHCKPIKRF